MMPPSTSPFNYSAEVASNGNRERCDTGGSAKSTLSLDLFDVLQLTSDGAMIPLRSAEFIEGVILPDTAATDAPSGKGEPPAAPSNVKPRPPYPLRDKGGKAATRLERNVTGDEISPLNMSFRISSGNWIGDYEAAESMNLLATTMHPSLFTGDPRNAVELEKSSTALPPVSLIDGSEEYQMPLRSSGHQAARMLAFKNLRISSRDWVTDFQEEPASSEPIHPGLFTEFMDDASTDSTTARPHAPPPQLKSTTYCDGERHISMTPPPHQSELMPPPPFPIAAKSLRTMPPSTAKATMPRPRMATPESNRKKKHRARQLDESIVVEPAENDVLCGRGGFTNSHPGNIRFREKALEFRPWYEQSSKEEKQRIADLLVESITSEGHRFLAKGKVGFWHEMVDGAHRKASQALRERMKRGSS